MKSMARSWVPPALWDFGRRAKAALRRRPHTFDGAYPDFAGISLPMAAGFGSAAGIEWALGKAQEQSRALRTLVPDNLRLKYLVDVLTSMESEVAVIDYGGGVGNTYLTMAPHLVRRELVAWSIVELPAVARAAREFLPETVDVFEELPRAFEYARARKTVLLARSVIQYDPHPFIAIERLLACRPDWIMISRVPAGTNPMFASVQHFHGGDHGIWFFHADDIARAVGAQGYELVDHWEELEEFPMENFPPTHRIGHSLGWLFRKVGHSPGADRRHGEEAPP